MVSERDRPPIDPRAHASGTPEATASDSPFFSSSPSSHAPAFAAGDVLAARFRIVRFIAAGGMGEVYEAFDEELRDAVALKTIRSDIARDEQSLKRFRREVLLARKVTHQNVCRTFDVFRHRRASPAGGDDVVFVSMELLAGETLAARLERGTMSPAETLPIVTQVADALAAAHRAGVVHRDLKSGNIMLLPPSAADTPPRVVVSDFGLAQGSTGAEVTLVDTAAKLLGTPAYMAPEQIEGGPITPAVDIYAFGIVIFEMLTGVRPFSADTPVATALKRLYEPPPLVRALAPDLDPRWEVVIQRCLARQPADRFSEATDVVAALTGSPVSQTLDLAAAAGHHDRRRRHSRSLALAALVALATIVAGVWLWRARTPAQIGPGQLELLVASERRAFDPAISPDGRFIVYVAEEDGRDDLFVADLRGESRVRLTNDDARETDPQVSPDGSRIVFTRLRPDARTSEIWSVPLLGGTLAPLVSTAADPAWSPDGKRLAFIHRPEPDGPLVLATANADGSDVRPVLRGDASDLHMRGVAWSPDEREIAFVRSRGGVTGELWIVEATGGSPRQLSHDSASAFSEDPVFTPDGTGIIHSSNRGGATNIWLMPRDGGTPTRVTTGPGPDDTPSIAGDGALVFGSSRWRSVLLTHDLAAGTTRTLLTHSRFLWAPAFSPDGREVAYSQGEIDGSWHVWVTPVSGDGAPRRLTSTDQGEIYPRYTPDGGFVLFHNWNAPASIWRVPRGGGPPALLPMAQKPGDTYADMSPDGRDVAFVRVDADGEHVYLSPVNAGEEARRLVAEPASVPRWSPKGDWIVFARDRGYNGGVFVVRPDGTALRRVSERGGWPIWWPDGQRIAYLALGPDGNQVLEQVPFEGGAPRRLDAVRYTGTNNPVAISPDGNLIATSDGIHVSDEIWLLRPAATP
jgi:Tol biopolymer transport system component/serine/threonine protein kinase